ncbi:Membrane steroid-binding protein 2 [Orobanche gracilis]
MGVEFREKLYESNAARQGLSPATFLTVLAVGFTIYYVVSNSFGSSDDHGRRSRRRSADSNKEQQTEPLSHPVQLGEISAEELKQYDGSDPKKPLLVAIKGQIYDVTHSRVFYGPGGPYAVYAGKDASRAFAKMSFETIDVSGDVTGLDVLELETLKDWERRFMSRYVKVGIVRTTSASN